MSIKRLAFCAICIALAAVTNLIRLYSFPFGGSVTFFSMLFVMLPAWLFGVRSGAMCGLVFGLIQLITNALVISIPQLLLDYILAFTVMGVAGFFRNSKHGLAMGYISAVIARWIVATLAGLAWVAAGSTAWDGWAPLPYSAAYNGAYIFAEAIITVIVICLPPVKKALEHVRSQI